MSNALKLVTDYNDYYDDGFDHNGDAFCRFSHSGLSLSSIYQALKKRSFRVPLHGVCKDLKEEFYPDSLVITQNPDFTLEVSSFQHILDTNPTSIIYEYIKGEVPKLIFRQVVIGNRAWMMRNTGTGYEVYDEVVPNVMLFDLPMYFIDIKKDSDIFYAVDFGLSPRLAETGMEQRLSPLNVIDLLKDHYYGNKNKNKK